MTFLCISPNSRNHGLQLYRQICSITASRGISKLARSQSRSVSLSSLNGHFHGHHELPSCSACWQSRYTVRRWVAIKIHRWEYKLNTRVLKVVEQYVVAMISRCNSSIPKEAVDLPRLLYSDSRCTQVCHRRSQLLLGLVSALPGLLMVLPELLSALPGLLSVLPDFLSALPDFLSALPDML